MFTFLGIGKSVTAPCEERINDRFCMRIYNPENESRTQFIKYGFGAGIVGILSFLIGRWMGIITERKHEKEGREWERRYSSDGAKLKRRHAREWN